MNRNLSMSSPFRCLSGPPGTRLANGRIRHRIHYVKSILADAICYAATHLETSIPQRFPGRIGQVEDFPLARWRICRQIGCATFVRPIHERSSCSPKCSRKIR
jgi:hypothetical protein